MKERKIWHKVKRKSSQTRELEKVGDRTGNNREEKVVVDKGIRGREKSNWEEEERSYVLLCCTFSACR